MTKKNIEKLAEFAENLLKEKIESKLDNFYRSARQLSHPMFGETITINLLKSSVKKDMKDYGFIKKELEKFGLDVLEYENRFNKIKTDYNLK